MLEINNEYGDIRFSKNVIVKIVEDAVERTEGRVVLMNYKGRYRNLMPGVDTEEVAVHDGEDGMSIEIYVALRFGSSISDVCGGIMEYVSDRVEKVMGERPRLVRVVLTAVISRDIASRHMVFEKYGNESEG